MLKLLAALGVVISLAYGGFKATHRTTATAASSTVVVRAPADGTGAALHLSGIDVLTSKPLSLDDYPGRPIVLNIWGSWCEACKQEGPELAKVERERPDVVVVGVDVQDSAAGAAAAIRGWGWTHPSFFDPQDRIAPTLPHGTEGVPTTYFLDAQHRIVDVKVSVLFADEFVSEIRRITGT